MRPLERPDRSRWRDQWPGIIGGACVAILVGLEVAEQDEFSLPDLIADIINLALTVGAAVGVAVVVQRLKTQHEERLSLIRDLESARIEGVLWRSRAHAHLAGLRAELDRQFADWGLSPAECEIGLLILKGLSHKEIAILRRTSEATVRQQAHMIYRKADLPGRTAFAAYFLDDLFQADADIRLSGAGTPAVLTPTDVR